MVTQETAALVAYAIQKGHRVTDCPACGVRADVHANMIRDTRKCVACGVFNGPTAEAVAVEPLRPVKATAGVLRTCVVCGGEFSARRSHAVMCGPRCRKRHCRRAASVTFPAAA